MGLDGKIRSNRERRPGIIQELDLRAAKARKATGKIRNPEKLHQKKRRLASLEQRLAAMKADHNAGTVRLCFGSRKLFRAQFHIEENGYVSHEQWREDWREARSSKFSIVGSKDETAGNQVCQARDLGESRFELRLTLTGGRLTLPVTVSYGAEALRAALASSVRVSHKTAGGVQTSVRTGMAVSYRFKRDVKDWRVLFSIDLPEVKCVSHRDAGRIAVDINADHLAVARLDRHGNIVDAARFACCPYGKSAEQAAAIIGDAINPLSRWRKRPASRS